MNIKEDKLHLEASMENLDTVLSCIENFIGELDSTGKIIKKCQLSVEEIFVNVTSYAYEGIDGEKYCDINFKVEYDDEKAKIVIEIRDRGRQFDPFSKEDPDITLKIKDRGVGGMGILMTKTLMDSYKYEYVKNENIVLLEKNWIL